MDTHERNVQIIKQKLAEIEQEKNVRIIMAVESGSRAWGFASPDSDYDVRFLYVRKTEDYLKLQGVRDVIEWQLDDVLDINGWDIKKGLQLLYKSNPTLFEWCMSPIVYRTSDDFVKLQQMASHYFAGKKSMYHYWHMANTNYREYLKGEMVRVKKYFYVLRPILAAKWILDKKTAPPMLFEELVDAELEAELVPVVQDLLQLKQHLPESGLAPKVQVLNGYIERNLVELHEIAATLSYDKNNWDELNAYFLELLGM